MSTNALKMTYPSAHRRMIQPSLRCSASLRVVRARETPPQVSTGTDDGELIDIADDVANRPRLIRLKRSRESERYLDAECIAISVIRKMTYRSECMVNVVPYIAYVNVSERDVPVESDLHRGHHVLKRYSLRRIPSSVVPTCNHRELVARAHVVVHHPDPAQPESVRENLNEQSRKPNPSLIVVNQFTVVLEGSWEGENVHGKVAESIAVRDQLLVTAHDHDLRRHLDQYRQ